MNLFNGFSMSSSGTALIWVNGEDGYVLAHNVALPRSATGR
jgi:hypothetical protein